MGNGQSRHGPVINHLLFIDLTVILATKRCSRPKSPRHGHRIGNDFSIGQKVWFMCDDGFEIEGSVVLQCLKNRTWNRPVPICKGNKAINDIFPGNR